MAVKSITAKLVGNAMLQVTHTGVKPTVVCSETKTLYVNAWSVAHASAALTRAHDALVRAYAEQSDTTTWDVKRLNVKIVKGLADPSHIGKIVEIDVTTKF